MKRAQCEPALQCPKRPTPLHLSTPQQCLLDYLLDASLCEVHDFFKRGGLELLPFFDIYLHKSAYSHIGEEEREFCRWYFLFSPNALLAKNKQFLLLKHIVEHNYRFLFEMLLHNRVLFWECSESNWWKHRICRLSLCLNQLVKLDCDWAIERIRSYALEKWCEGLGRCDLVHRVFVKPRTWRQEYPMRVFRKTGLDIVVRYPAQPPYSQQMIVCDEQLSFLQDTQQQRPALVMHCTDQREEFTLDNLIELDKYGKAVVPLLVSKFVHWYDMSNKSTHNYFRILASFKEHMNERWDDVLFWRCASDSFRVNSFGLLPNGDYAFFRGLRWYFNRHPASEETAWHLRGLFSPLPEFLFVSDPSTERLALQANCDEHYSETLWNKFTDNDVRSMLMHAQRRLLVGQDAKGPTNVATYLLFMALVSQRYDLAQLILAEYERSVDFDTLRLERVGSKRLSWALDAQGYRTLLRPYLLGSCSESRVAFTLWLIGSVRLYITEDHEHHQQFSQRLRCVRDMANAQHLNKVRVKTIEDLQAVLNSTKVVK